MLQIFGDYCGQFEANDTEEPKKAPDPKWKNVAKKIKK